VHRSKKQTRELLGSSFFITFNLCEVSKVADTTVVSSKGAVQTAVETAREAKYRRFEELKGLILCLQLRSYYRDAPAEIDHWVGSFDLKCWDKVYHRSSDRDCRHARAFARSIAAKDRSIILESRSANVPLWPLAWKEIAWFRGSLERFRRYYKDILRECIQTNLPENEVDNYLVE